MEFTEFFPDQSMSLQANHGTATAVAIRPRTAKAPSPKDWQRWRPEIFKRYKSTPARIFVEEMKRDGLFVRYQQQQRAEDVWEIFEVRFECPPVAIKRIGPEPGKRWPGYANAHSKLAVAYLQHPRGRGLVLEDAIRICCMDEGHDDRCAVYEQTTGLHQPGRFINPVLNSLGCLFLSVRELEGRGTRPRLLARRTNSAAKDLSLHLNSVVHPLTIMGSFDVFTFFRRTKGPLISEWRTATRSFLMRVVTERLGPSHPAALLWQTLLTDGLTPGAVVVTLNLMIALSREHPDRSREIVGLYGRRQTLKDGGGAAELENYLRSLVRQAISHGDQMQTYQLHSLAFNAPGKGNPDGTEQLIQRANQKLKAITDSSTILNRGIAHRSWTTLALIAGFKKDVGAKEHALLRVMRFAFGPGKEHANGLTAAIHDLMKLDKNYGDTKKLSALMTRYPRITKRSDPTYTEDEDTDLSDAEEVVAA